ncbi:ABC transporter substrate-binding protein [Devosia nitrariae]|uniref:ABC transporter substrate-binding protein n=1 Tax=Devosia nitrariae TaxID=2071872 RepID=A0ABQ5W0G1_9HYPH|nr:extracellular solute-binding protein [Devosia nitrariae]GLQ53359.1 ABC transporter substrate-binding protein [Devosia nitrariae]
MKTNGLMKSTAMLAALAGAAFAVPATVQAQNLVVWGSDLQADPLVNELWQEIKTRFEEANPGVTIEYMPPTGNISDGAVQAAIQSEAGPDVLLTNSGIGRVTIVANAKLVQPLTAQYEELGWKDKIYPWLYEQLSTQFNGEIYEVPDGVDAIAIWYHKDMFEENGWSLEGGWADFTATLDAIKAAGVEPIAVGIRNCCNGGHLIGNFLQAAAGPQMMGEVVAGEVPWTDPAVVAGAQNLVDSVKAGHINPQMTSLDQDAAIRLWANKRAAIFFGGPWFINNVRQLDYDLANLGYATIPSDLDDGSRPTGGVGWSWMVPVSSKQPELAMKWIDFMLSEEIMMLRAEHQTSSQLMARDLPDVEPVVPVMGEVFAAAAEGVGYNPSVYIPGSALDTYYQVIGGLVGGQVSPEDGLAQIEAKMGD